MASWQHISRKDVEGYRIRRHSLSGRFGDNKLLAYPLSTRIEVYSDPNYFKFLSVRHPLERFLSAYRDKVQPYINLAQDRKVLLKNKLKQENSQNHSIQLNPTWPNSIITSLQAKKIEMDTFSFHMFIYLIVIKGIKRGYGGTRVRHWHKYYDLCRVCNLDWNYISKMESMSLDSQLIFQKIGRPDFAIGQKSKSNDYTKMVTYFKGLSLEIVQELHDVYLEDFDLFNYQIDDWLVSHLVDH